MKARSARAAAAIVGPALVLAVAVVVSVGSGAMAIDVSATLSALLGGLRGRGPSLEGAQAIVWNLRMPRVLMAVVVGASLGSSGAAMQGFFRNPLADPYVLGVAGGASFGATVAMTVGGRLSEGFAAGPFASGGAPAWVPLFAFAGAAAAVLAVLVFSRAGTGSRTTSLLLAGIVVGAIFVSIDEFLLLIDADRLRAVFSWSVGNLSLSSWTDVGRATPYAVAGMALLFVLARGLDAMALGDDTARTLGVDTAAPARGGDRGRHPRAARHRRLRGRHRVRGTRRAARHAAARPSRTSGAHPGVGARGRGAAGVRRPRCAHRHPPERAARRHRHDPRGRALLPVAAPEGDVTDLLSAEDVHLGYGDRAVLKGVSFAVRAGEVVALIGPNGAGKTSLLKTLAGLVVPGKGRVMVSAERSRSVAYLAQGEGGSPPTSRRARSSRLGRLPYVGMWHDLGEDDERAIARAMQRTATNELAGRRVGALSGGERQRVALARAIAQEPRVLLLDEPTTHLDLRHQVELFASLREEARYGTAVVSVMHDLTFAAQADRCVLLADGTVRADGPPSDALRPEVLADVYGTPIDVMRAADGSIAALVARPRV